MLFKSASFRFCEANMSEVVKEAVAVNNEVTVKATIDEDFDKDSGNHSGEEMDNGDDVTCAGQKKECELDKDGPHCHVDKDESKPNSRRSSIEELKAKIASVSRRNSFGSRRSSLTGSRRNSIQEPIKEDPTCEEECVGAGAAGDHCHVASDVSSNVAKPQSDPTCNKPCPDNSEPHCHEDNINGTNGFNGDNNGTGHDKNVDDPTCVKAAAECPDSVQADHCQDDTEGQNIDNDVTVTDTSHANDRKQFLQPNSPEPVSSLDLAPSPVSVEPTSTNSTPPTARKVIPVNMKTEQEKTPTVCSSSSATEPDTTDTVTPVTSVNTMPPTETTSETIILPRESDNKTVDLEDNCKDTERKARSGREESRAARVDTRTSSSKSRPTSPSSESRRSRFSSKERKSKIY